MLSNAPILEGICEDRLPELPREASLIASASRADVVGLLQQQAGGVGPDVAVRLTAGTLADGRSLDPAACVWVVSEFARCLGYTVSDAIAPAGVGAAGGPQPVATALAAVPAAPAPPEQPGPVTPAMDAPTMVPPATPMPTPAPMPGPPPGQVPAAAMPMPAPPPAQAAAGFNQPVTQGPGPAGWGGQAPAGWGGQGGGGGFPPPPSPPRPSKGRGPVLASVGVAAVAVLYLIVAGVASLPPFGGKASPKPSGSSSPSASVSASVSSSPNPPPAGTPGQTLRNLIPGSFQAKGECVNKKTGWPGQTAEITCTGAPNVPGDYVTYYLFRSTSALNKAYAGFLSQYAKTTQGAGSCDSFKAFRSCETIYGPTAKNSNVGHIVEYKYKNTPDISYTVSKDLLIIDTGGANGNGMVTWWAGLPPPWLSASGWATATG